MQSEEDVRACSEFRAEYKKRIDEGVDITQAVEMCYAEMLTPQQINLLGGLSAVYKEAHRYKVFRTKRIM